MPERALRPLPVYCRIASLDVLRGFALLGILTMNISLGLPAAARLNPTVAGGFTGLNFGLWLAGYFLFDEKMITLFAMLFGAGLFLQTDRAERLGLDPARLHYRRMFFLLLIGLVHSYGIWEGDILVTYALCGMAVYPLRRRDPRFLLVTGAALWLVAVPLARIFTAHLASSPELLHSLEPSSADLAKEIRLLQQGTWLQIAARRVPEAFGVQTVALAASFFWTVSARMLFGIALFQTGFFSGSFSSRQYLRIAFASYAAGFPLVAGAANGLIQQNFGAVYLFSTGLLLNAAGALFVAVGHASLLIVLCRQSQQGWPGGLLRRLGAAGRMALSNYIGQTLLTTALFYGYGFRLFGTLDRAELYILVAVIWALQLWLSPLWLRHFRFGPVEWVWRSLTYGRRQSFRVPALFPVPDKCG